MPCRMRRVPVIRDRHASRSVAMAAAAALLLAACQVPNFRGPQVQNPPDGYVPRLDLEQERRMFPDLALTHHDAWIESSVQEAGSIHVNGHHGSLGADAVQAARDAAEARAPDGVTIGGLERLVVDGREAWGWSERLTAPDGSVRRVGYRVAVAYDTVTYAVEFETTEPEMTGRPDSVRAIVASFAVGETRWNLPAIAVIAAVLLLGIRAFRSRAERRAEHQRTITLAKVPAAERGGRRGGAEGGAPAEGGE